MSTPASIALACVVLAVAALWVAVRSIRRRDRIKKRMAPIAGLLTGGALEAEPEKDAQRETPRESGPRQWLDARYPLSGGVRTAVIGVAAGGGSFALLWLALTFFGMSVALAATISIIIGAGLAWQTGSMLEQGKRTVFGDRFLIVLEDFQRMVRHGIATGQALASVAAAAEEPAKASLSRVVLETGFGVSVAAAIEREAQRVRVSELSMLAAIIGTQSTTGGNLSESLENLAKMVRERRDARSRMRASTAESRITMIILTFIPAAAVGIQALSQPELIDVLLSEGRHLLGIGVTLIVIGLGLAALIIRRAQHE